MQLRKYALAASLAGIAAGGAYAGYESDIFKRYSDRARDAVLTRTAEAGFKVRDILVTGRAEIPATEILERLSIKQGMPIFGVSIADAETSLTSIPWVKNVRISRRLPGTILIALDERKPLALWQYQKKISLIDGEGAVLTSENLDAWKQLPLVVGAGAEKNAAALVGMLNAEPALAANLVAAVRVEDRRWDLQLKNNVTVRLPENDMEFALRRLGALDEQKNLLGRNITAIDLRQPERIVVALPPELAGDKKADTRKTPARKNT